MTKSLGNNQNGSIGGQNKGMLIYYLALLLSLVGFASVPLAGKISLNSFGPVTFAWLRGVTGFLVVLPFAYKRGFRFKQLFRKRSMFYGLIAFVLNTVIFQLGLQWCSANVSSIVQAFIPIMMLIGGVLFLSEKMTMWKEIGAVLSVGGILVTCIGGSLVDKNTTWYGILMIATASLTWTIYTVFMKKYDADTDPLIICEYVMGCGSIIAFPFVVGETAVVGVPDIGFSTILLILFAGAYCMGVANMAWTFAVSKIEATISGICFNLCPIMGVIFAFIFGETISALQWIGCAAVILGVVLGIKDENILKRRE